MFFQHSQAGASRRGGDNFMNGLYRLFLGDARPNSVNDEWVFSDVDSIQEIIIPAARIALKVHQVREGGREGGKYSLCFFSTG